MAKIEHILLTTIAAVVLVGCNPEPPEISIEDAVFKGNIKAVKQHIAAGTELNTGRRNPPLAHATMCGKWDIAKLLIAEGVDVNVKNLRGMTPLHEAALRGLKEIIELIIDNGADVNAKDSMGTTPLDWAEEEKDKEIADLLRKHGGKTKRELEAEGK